MKYTEFKKKVYLQTDSFTVTIDSNNDTEVYMDGATEDPLAIISNKRINKFSINPGDPYVGPWKVSYELYNLIFKYASTPIDERRIDEHESDERDKEIADLKYRVDSLESANRLMKASSICNNNSLSSYESSLYGSVLGLKNDMDIIKDKKPRWFE